MLTVVEPWLYLGSLSFFVFFYVCNFKLNIFKSTKNIYVLQEYFLYSTRVPQATLPLKLPDLEFYYLILIYW